MSLADARRSFPGAVYVLTHLDPMTAGQARRVVSHRRPDRPLVVVLADPPDPLLPASARAVLAAALDEVDAVTSAPELESGWVDDRAASLDERTRLIARVWRRHGGD